MSLLVLFVGTTVVFLCMCVQNVGEKQKSCEEDLAKAEPALLAAQEALNTLNKVGVKPNLLWHSKPPPQPYHTALP